MDVYFPVLCGFAEKILPDASLAKDVAQETFIRYWKSENRFDSLNNLKAYLLVSTRNGCLNYLRGRDRQAKTHKAVQDQSPIETDSILTEIVKNELLALIYQTVGEMSPSMQEVFYLSFREGMTVKEISAHLNRNIKAVKKQKYKALVILRTKFGPNRDLLALLFILLLQEFKNY